MDALTILASLVTIIGLPILIWSIIMLSRQLKVQAYQAIYESILSIDQFLLDRPELRNFLYEREPLPEGDPIKLQRILGAADMLLTFFEHVTGQRENMSNMKWVGWQKYMRYVYHNSPAVRAFLDQKTNLVQP